MNIQAYLLLAVIAISLAQRTTDGQVSEIRSLCQHGLSQKQWLFEQAENEINLNEAKKTFKTSSKSFISKLFQYLHAQNRQVQKQQFLEYLSKINPQLQQYSDSSKYMLFALSLVFAYWISKIIQIKYNLHLVSFNFSHGFMKSAIKLLKIFLIVFAIVSLYFSFRGYREGNKTQKTLSSLICKVFDEPKGVIKGGSGPQHDGYQAYVSQIQKYMNTFTINFDSIKQLIKKQYLIGQIVKFGKQIIAITQNNNTFTQLMNKTVSKLSSADLKLTEIKQSLIHNKTIEESRELIIMLQYQLKAVQSYSKINLLITKSISFFGLLIKFFYGSIIFISVLVIAVILLKRKIHINKAFIQYLFATFTFLCLSSSYLGSYAVPGLALLSPIVDQLSENQNVIRHQLKGVKTDIVQILSRFIPINGKDLTAIYQNHLINNITQFDSIIQQFYKLDESYLDKLFETGIRQTKSKNFDTSRINFLIQKNLMKQVLINLKKSQQGIRQILSTVSQNGQLAIIYPESMGNHIREIYKIIRVPLFNRIYNARYNCSNIGFFLLLILICSIALEEFNSLMKSKKEFAKIQKGQNIESQQLMADSMN